MCSERQVNTFPDVTYVLLFERAAKALVCEGPEMHQPIVISLPLTELNFRWRHSVDPFLAQGPEKFLVKQGGVKAKLLCKRENIVWQARSLFAADNLGL